MKNKKKQTWRRKVGVVVALSVIVPATFSILIYCFQYENNRHQVTSLLDGKSTTNRITSIAVQNRSGSFVSIRDVEALENLNRALIQSAPAGLHVSGSTSVRRCTLRVSTAPLVEDEISLTIFDGHVIIGHMKSFLSDEQSLFRYDFHQGDISRLIEAIDGVISN